VSDNSDEGCRELVESFADPRVRYVRPESYMTTVPHWNFAFSHAVGEWQLLLCDDDAIVPGLLAVLDREIAAHPNARTIKWEFGSYVENASGFAARTHFTVPAFSRRREIRRCDAVLREAFRSGGGYQPVRAGDISLKRVMPLLSHAAYERSLINCIRRALGGALFLPICPMTSAAAAALALSDETLRIDLPLAVLGQTIDSAGGYLADLATYERMHRDAQFEFVPIKTMMLFPTVTAETLLRTRSVMQDELGAYELNWEEYFLACCRALSELSAHPSYADVKVMIDRSLEAHPPALSMAVRTRIAREQHAVDRAVSPSAVEQMARRLRVLPQQAGAMLGLCGPPRGRVLDPASLGLASIADCAAYLSSAAH